jgi:streptomycin 6-kinase
MTKTVDQYCRDWNLQHPILLATTPTSTIYKVRFGTDSAVLKMFTPKGREFEAVGAIVLRCFNGNGSARLLKSDDDAHLLEYVDGRHLRLLVDNGQDEEATRVVCQVIHALHSYAGPSPGELISMERNFRELFLRAENETSSSIFVAGARMARTLIETPGEIRVLHGDIHHENVLESSTRGWLAIDPQCLVGERTYDVTNTFYNPDGCLA